MHYLTLKEKVERGDLLVEAGEYITDDVTAAHLLVLANGGTMEPVRIVRRFIQEDPPKSVLFSRIGGFGDLVLLTPVLRQLKAKHPQVKIGVSAMRHYADAIKNIPYVDEILPYPCSREKTESYDAWVFYENAIENNKRAESVHMTDLFAEIAGVDMADADKLPDYRVKPSEAIWANEAYPPTPNMRRVCIQVGTSALCRTYPRPLMGQVISELLKRGYEVFLMGQKGEIQLNEGQLRKGLKNLADADLTFRQSCAVLATAHCVIGADSALVHVAGALKVPAVALYGPFPWKLRTAYVPTTHALNGNGDCAPCFHHYRPAWKNHFPENCPSKDKHHCQVLAEIKPERIVAVVEKIAKAGGEPVFTPLEVIEEGKAK